MRRKFSTETGVYGPAVLRYPWLDLHDFLSKQCTGHWARHGFTLPQNVEEKVQIQREMMAVTVEMRARRKLMTTIPRP